MKPDRRGSWYLLTGVVMGVAFGLVYSWLVSPVNYVDAPPYALRADYKDEYRAMVAFAYQYNHDLLRAVGRLAQLKDDSPAQTLALQAQRALADGHPAQEVQALNTLALALAGRVTPETGPNSGAFLSTVTPGSAQVTPTGLILEPSPSPTVTLSVTPTLTITIPLNTYSVLPRVSTSTPQPSPTATPSPTAGAPFVLQETRMVCNINQSPALIQVNLLDAAGQPVPSIEMLVSWETGADHFFTGLQPEVGLGYGDYAMTPGVAYTLQPANGGERVSDLTAAECVAEDGSHFWGSWYLVFVQP